MRLPANTRRNSDNYSSQRSKVIKAFLICGILSSVLYIATDILAAMRYPGCSFTAQAVSEWFAIGAPTSRLVVPFFLTVHSLLLLAFALGIWMSAGRSRTTASATGPSC
jgi:hypothetical protein